MLFDSKLKTVSVEEIQNAIATAIAALVHEELECRVCELKFDDTFKTTMHLEFGPKIDIGFIEGGGKIAGDENSGRDSSSE